MCGFHSRYSDLPHFYSAHIVANLHQASLRPHMHARLGQQPVYMRRVQPVYMWLKPIYLGQHQAHIWLHTVYLGQHQAHLWLHPCLLGAAARGAVRAWVRLISVHDTTAARKSLDTAVVPESDSL
jgi:hypothetical protein